MAKADMAVTTRLPPKYLYVEWILRLTSSDHILQLNIFLCDVNRWKLVFFEEQLIHYYLTKAKQLNLYNNTSFFELATKDKT